MVEPTISFGRKENQIAFNDVKTLPLPQDQI